jgi:peroxiredoxin
MSRKVTGIAVVAALAVGLTAFATLQAGEGHKGHDHKHDGGKHHDKKMSKAEVGEKAPMFKLKTAEGEKVKLAELIEQDKTVVLEWFNPDCPYVERHYEKQDTMKRLASKYADKDVVWLRVNSSHYADAKYNKKWAKKWEIERPILVDQDGKVGRMYKAKTTPHMYIINGEGKLVYAGAIDDNRSVDPRDDPEETVNYVDRALQSLLAEEDIETAETKPYGCSVKYGKKADASTGDAPVMVAMSDDKGDGEKCENCRCD